MATLEQVCCKKHKKKATDLWNRGPLKILNGPGLIYNQFGIIQVLHRSPIPQTSKGTFYSEDVDEIVIMTFM